MAAAAGHWHWVAVLIGGGLLAAAYVFRVLRLAFLPAPERIEAQPVGRTMPAAALSLALVAAFGAFAAQPLREALDLPALAWRAR